MLVWRHTSGVDDNEDDRLSFATQDGHVVRRDRERQRGEGEKEEGPERDGLPRFFSEVSKGWFVFAWKCKQREFCVDERGAQRRDRG
jgi:hypothetical protein